MFASAKQKIDRANYHITDLERQFADFIASKPHRFSVQSDQKTGQLAINIRFLKDPPGSFALVIGDAIHNLRSALDHMMWELAGFDHGTQDRYLKFPTGDSRINFEASCNGIITPSQWVKDAIKATEAFAGGGGLDLYQLHQLDNADKHTVLTPVLRGTGHPDLTVFMPDGERIRVERNVFGGGVFGSVSIGSFPPGSTVELDNDAECPPSIFIGEGPRQFPVLPLLRQYRIAVVQAVETVERKVPR